MPKKKLALSKDFFTKEFGGFEIESKWTLLTENPVPTLLRFLEDIQSDKWDSIIVAKQMGKLPVGLRYFELRFDFWGTLETAGPSDYRQVAMVAVLPEAGLYQVAFKERSTLKLTGNQNCFNPPLIRKEDRKGDWISESNAISQILNRYPKAEKVGVMIRQKCFAYIHNTQSHRNFSISADLCKSNKKSLSQVEVEYKGRNGIWLPDTSGDQIIADFVHIHNVLSSSYTNILKPTIKTKFDWIIGE